jgi:hypothetical protein
MKTSMILILGSLLATAAFAQEKTPDKRLEHAANSLDAIQTSDKPQPPPPGGKSPCG